MDDAWERVVEAALDGQGTRSSELRVLNLDGAVKSLHGCLPPARILERFPSLEHLSIANVGVLSLEKFPRLRNLQRLILSDNRIAGGLENLVQAGLHSLRDLDLSNNRIQYIEDLAPLAKLHLVSLDLYECPVTRVNDYRSKVFSMIRTLKYLDKLDANEDERPETDDDDEEEEYDYDDFDPGSGEVDGDDRAGKLANGCADYADVDDVIVDADEGEESDADEEETETSGRGSANGFSIGSGHHLSNGFRVAAVGVVSVDGNENDADEDVEVEDDDDDDDLGEEIDEEEGEDTDVVDVHNVFNSDEEDEDGVDDVEDDEVDTDEDGDDDEDLEDDDEVDVDEYDVGVEDEEDTEPGRSGRLARFEEEIDGHEHGEEDENGEIGLHDENGEIGEEDELGLEDRDVEEDFGDGEDEDDIDGDYLVQPIARPNGPSRQSDFNVDNEEEDYIDPDDDSRKDNTLQQAFNDSNKRRRDDEGDLDDDDTDNAEELRPSKRR